MELRTVKLTIPIFSNISNYTAGNETDTLPFESPYHVVEVVLIVLATGSLSLLTITGNILVILSIIINRSLQTINNYFLFSLACADLIIGVIVMNLYTVYLAVGYWPLGPVACYLWLILDYVVCNVSGFHLTVISFDRYFCIAKPLSYPAWRTTRIAGMMIAAPWVLAFLLWGPPILSRQFTVVEHIVPVCYLDFQSNESITYVSSVASLFLPIAIMSLLYCQISRASKSRVKTGEHKQKKGKGFQSEALPSREKKVTLMITMIIVAYVVAWTPYNVMMVISTFCSTCVTSSVWIFGFWSSYMNSIVNPACYALCNVSFKKTFKKLLLCKHKDIRSGR